MENYKCPHCGSSETPITKAIWGTKEKLTAVVLLIGFFPIGIFYIIKQNANKQQVCPVCKKTFSGMEETSFADDIDKMKTVVKTVAKDPEVRQALKDVKKGAKDVQNSFYVN